MAKMHFHCNLRNTVIRDRRKYLDEIGTWYLNIMNRFKTDNSLPLTGSNLTYGMSTRLPKLKNGLTGFKWVRVINNSMFAYYPDHTTRFTDTICFSYRFKNRVCGIYMSFWCSLFTKTQKPELIFLTRF